MKRIVICDDIEKERRILKEALERYEVQASGYLLKPLSQEKLDRLLNRLLQPAYYSYFVSHSVENLPKLGEA